MGWTPQFLEALAAPVYTPRFFLEVSKEPGCPGASGVKFYSHQSPFDGDPGHAISRTGLRVSSGAVSVLSWSTSYGGLVVGIHGGAGTATAVLQSIVKGSIVRLFLGFEGWGHGEFEPIFTGQVRQLRGTPQRGYTLECLDIVRALGSRWTTTAGRAALFYNLRELASTTVKTGVDYTAGDPTIDVTSSASFERETGGNYLLRVTGTSGTFYIRATGLTGAQFTGLSTGIYGTTDADAAAGNKVEHMALLQDGPIDIVKKILISTAGGTGGTFDTYPGAWGFALPIDWLDTADIDDVATRYHIGTTWNLDVVVTEAQTDPASWLSGVLEPCGMWLVHRQGQISLRYSQNPYLTTPGTIPADFHVSDSDMESVLDWQAWDGSRAIEYQDVSVDVAASGIPASTSTDPVSTLPNAKAYTITLDHLWDTTSTNETDAQLDVRRRSEIWAHRISERVSVLLSGLAYAGLVAGDIGRISSSVIPSRDSGGTSSRACMVLSCEPDWLAGVVRLDLALPAEWSTEFPT